MTILLIVAGAIAGLLMLNAVLGMLDRRFPTRHALTGESLQSLLTALLHQGDDSCVLFIQRVSGPEFLQYRKYIRAPGHVGIELGFPESTWSGEYVDDLKSMLQEQGLQYTIVQTGSEPTKAFVMVDFARNVGRARRLADAIVSSLFQLPEEEFRCHFEGPFDVRPTARVGF